MNGPARLWLEDSQELSFIDNIERISKENAPSISVKSATTLSIIIPLRLTGSREDYADRINFFLEDTNLPDGISVVVVDDGSRPEYLEMLRGRARDPRINILSTGRKHYELFNIAHARNHGAQHAPGEFLLFLDVDLIPYPGFFRDLLREIDIMDMHRQAQNFLMCPVIYLTKAGYEKFNSLPSDLRRQFFISAMLRGDKTLIEKHSSGTSAIVLRKDYFLMRGGNDTHFEGWGYEDYEFTTRLMRRSRMFPHPDDWMSMAGNFTTVRAYRGWKSAYRLHGDWLAQKGIWLFHAPHQIEKSFHYNKDANWRLLRSRMQADAEGENEPEALPDLAAGRSLFLAKNPFCYGRDIAPFFGEAAFATDLPEGDLGKIIKRKKIDRVVFANPYRNDRTIAAYKWCREYNVPIVVCERGALPDSVFHDRSGFLTDSNSYSPEKWDRPLLPAEIEAIESYIRDIRFGNKLVEQQAERSDLHEIRSQLGIGRRQKVLLVPFQQPKDTVIRHFAGAIGSFTNFHKLVCSLPQQLGSGWRVVYKKHPVEDDVASVPDAANGENFNIYDLIEIADSMLVMNSGTGLYGMMFGKPVYIASDCWYADERMNTPIIEFDTLAARIKAGFAMDYDRMLRFIHYLRFEFYSFGHQAQRRFRYNDGSPITSTSDIKYYEIRGFTAEPLHIGSAGDSVPMSSPLFDRYRNASTGDMETAPAATPGSAASNKRKTSLRKRIHMREACLDLLRPLRRLLSRA
jgi:predicted glycosyltransferase involved in capsule biosynthesis